MKNINKMNFRQRKVHHGSQEIFMGDVEREKEGPMVRLNQGFQRTKTFAKFFIHILQTYPRNFVKRRNRNNAGFSEKKYPKVSRKIAKMFAFS